MLRRRLIGRVLADEALDDPLPEPLGLGDDRLRELAAEHRFGSLASFFPGLGTPLELRVVAWWGSALADVACAAGRGPRDDALLADAARFYLGVALFDEVVDGASDGTVELAAALEPWRLRRKLESPSHPQARLRCPAPDLGLVVDLFDKALEGIGCRFARDAGRREEIAGMLEAMYRSELSLSPDPLGAKILPFVLIGHLALGPSDAAARAFFARFAELLCLWDDWQDLAADGWAGAANSHLGAAAPPVGVRGLVRGLGVGLLGMLPGHPVSRRLTRALEATLDAARLVPPAARAKTKTLVRHMLGEGPSADPVSARRPDARAPSATRRRPAGSAPPPARGSA